MTHFELLDAVNDAVTAAEHERLLAVLEGYRMCLDEIYGGWSGLQCDDYTMERYGEDADMCCGVLSCVARWPDE